MKAFVLKVRDDGKQQGPQMWLPMGSRLLQAVVSAIPALLGLYSGTPRLCP